MICDEGLQNVKTKEDTMHTKSIIITNVHFNGFCFAYDIESAEGVFIPAGVADNHDVKAGDSINAVLIPNYSDKASSTPWMAIKIENGVKVPQPETTGEVIELPEPEPEPEPKENIAKSNKSLESTSKNNETLVAEESKPVKKKFFDRVFKRKEEIEKTEKKRLFDDNMLESLEELLISADMGVDTSLRVSANMADGNLGKKVSVNEVKILLGNEVARILEPVAKPMPLYSQKPQVVLVVGVNGSGKTTTIGKLASQFRSAGKSVVIAAGDTFRAAAVEQLQVWGERAGVPVLTAPEGSDPASLAFDAMNKCKNDNVDLLMIDTAGRLQNRKDLMEELDKIVRVIQKNDPSAPHNTLLVLDATTGQNAIRQVEVFQEVSKVTGLVMTKLDGTAKGGVLVALADKFGLPIHAIGVGEQIDDLQAFDPKDFAKALTGSDK